MNRFHNDADSSVNANLLLKRQRSEWRDRNFIRRALRRGSPTEAIQARLLRKTEFHRLNPDRDPNHYIRGLIDEEGGSLRPPDLTDGRAAHASANPENSARFREAVCKERESGSEAIARRYIQENFEPADWLAVVVRNRETGDTVQRITTAKQIASPEFQSWLRHKNAHGSDIYLSLNTLKEHAHGRTKRDVKQIRHLYLDLDEQGQRKLAAIYQDAAVPHPNYVLETSPGKYQVVWRVEGIAQKDAEDFLRGLARRFGGDPAATDATRVFRLPGFNNKKYDENFRVKLAAGTFPDTVYRQLDFRIEPISPGPGATVRITGWAATTGASATAKTQSEKDWAYALSHLRRGHNPDDIIREIAAYRAIDRYDSQDASIVVSSRKPNPRYYAEHTVSRAMGHLGITEPVNSNESKSPEIEPDR
jgi:hypothetical protein